jgi:uncharacterized RDD family membrane protein YckC
MRCPKCQYISFGSEPRCRNCGYDFSLAAEEDDAFDLPMQGGDAVGPLADLPLSGSSRNTPLPPGAVVDAAIAERSELPLFESEDDRPLVTPPAVPRVPLSVRRAAPVMPRPRGRTANDEEPQLDLEDEETFRSSRQPAQPITRGSEPQTEVQEATTKVSAIARAIGAGIDLTIMGVIDALVIYLTLRATGLEPAGLWRLPKIPLVGFLMLLNGGYLVLFTAAGGQTIGKMATGIRVVPQDPALGLRVPFATAVVRAVTYAVSLLPAGLGFLPILFSPDGRALHDRLADTRVIKA